MRYVYLGLGVCLVAGIMLMIFFSAMWLLIVVLVASLAATLSCIVRRR